MKGWRKRGYIIFAGISLFILSFFFYISDKYNQNLFRLQKQHKTVLSLKISHSNLAELNKRNNTGSWINVYLLRGLEEEIGIKIKSQYRTAVIDFDINIGGNIYHLFKLNSQRQKMLNFYKKAKLWGIQSTTPEPLQLKINNVLIGIYIFEAHMYQQIRDNQGKYYITLSTDTHLTRKLFYEASLGLTHTFKKYFLPDLTISYLVYFSLFCDNSVFEYDRLGFKYDNEMEKFLPFLTFQSVVFSFEDQQKTFQQSNYPITNYYDKLSEVNIGRLLRRSPQYRLGTFLALILSERLGHSLIEAARKGDLDSARSLIQNGANINYLDKRMGWYPLQQAVYWGNFNMVKLLLRAGANPRLKYKNYPSALATATTAGNRKILQLMDDSQQQKVYNTHPIQ